ncbi:MAG: hypothetical protein ABIJ09_26750 [Pseudomonadota bacterium]
MLTILLMVSGLCSSVAAADLSEEARTRLDLEELTLAEAELHEAMVELLAPGELLSKAVSQHRVLSRHDQQILLQRWKRARTAMDRVDAVARLTTMALASSPLCQDALCHERAALGAVARLTKLVHGTGLLVLLRAAPKLQVTLDDESSQFGQRGGEAGRFRDQVYDARDLSLLLGYARTRAAHMSGLYARHGQHTVDRERWLLHFWIRHSGLIENALTGTDAGNAWFDATLTERVRGFLDQAAKEITRPLARVFGRTKVIRPGRYLIALEQAEVMVTQLEPGDIVLEKTQGYLCNWFIKGYWGHAMLYLGSYDEAMAAFDAPELRAAFAARGARDFEDYLIQHAPEAARAWRSGRDPGGREMRFIEGDGIAGQVVFSSTAQAMDADSLAALRPRLSRLDKALAIADALTYWQRAFDYALDLSTDSALMCTELVARAYAAEPGKQGLTLPARSIGGGRFMVIPSDIAEQYARDVAHPGRQLDFVYLLRADEVHERSTVGSEVEFRGSADWKTLL